MTTYKGRNLDDQFDEDEFQFIIDQGHDSDFLLEMAAARCLRKAGFDVAHSGFYTDTATLKARQYDLRASMLSKQGDVQFYLCLEVKNVGKNYPLLVSTTPRERNERFLNYVERFSLPGMIGLSSKQIDTPLYGERNVGRDLSQFKRIKDSSVPTKKGGLDSFVYSTGNDQVAEKWMQAISQLQALVEEIKANKAFKKIPTFFIPILVVNNDTLWEVGYNQDSKVECPPHSVQQADLMISKGFTIQYHSSSPTLVISHLHITTIDGLPTLLTKILETRV